MRALRTPLSVVLAGGWEAGEEMECDPASLRDGGEWSDCTTRRAPPWCVVDRGRSVCGSWLSVRERFERGVLDGGRWGDVDFEEESSERAGVHHLAR